VLHSVMTRVSSLELETVELSASGTSSPHKSDALLTNRCVSNISVIS